VKALTLKQPWASLVALGAKQIETRSWRTSYQGLLAIHAGAEFLEPQRRLSRRAGFAQALGDKELPLGAVIATCTLIGCVPTEWLPICILGQATPSPKERLFGDYSSGRWAWLLADVEPLSWPIAAVGKLRLWNWELS
jgi:activating signal cointegrator 1